MSENQANVDARIRDKIARLRARLRVIEGSADPQLINVIKGILDLLGDEL